MFSVIIALLFIHSTESILLDTISTKNKWFIDESGRTVLFRGKF